MSEQQADDLAYSDPLDLPEADARRLDLTSAIQQIQSQLADQNRQIDGRPMTEIEWHRWRRSAVSALAFKHDELRRVKAWIRDHHRAEQDAKIQRVVADDEGVMIRKAAGAAMNDLWEYCKRLEAALAEARAAKS